MIDKRQVRDLGTLIFVYEAANVLRQSRFYQCQPRLARDSSSAARRRSRVSV